MSSIIDNPLTVFWTLPNNLPSFASQDSCGTSAAWELAVQDAFSTLTSRGSERTPGKTGLHQHIQGFRRALSALMAFVVICVSGAVAARATEPIITLKMAKLEVPDRRFPITRDRLVVNAPVAPENRDQRALENFKPLAAEKFTLPANLLLAKPNRASKNPLVLTRKNSRVNSHVGLWASASIQAGYGQIFFDQTEKTYCPTGNGWQEPGCGYLKIRFRF